MLSDSVVHNYDGNRMKEILSFEKKKKMPPYVLVCEKTMRKNAEKQCLYEGNILLLCIKLDHTLQMKGW